jgi:hypothetical protein
LGAGPQGIGSSRNVIGIGSSRNVIGIGSSRNVIGIGSSRNMIGIGSSRNVIGTGSSRNVIGESDIQGKHVCGAGESYGLLLVGVQQGISGLVLKGSALYGKPILLHSTCV